MTTAFNSRAIGHHKMPDLLSGRYRIERLLGAGGMGAVYQARDLLHETVGEPDARVAIKMLNEALAQAPDAGAVLYREFALMRHLHHPNVVRPYAFDIDPDSNRAFMTLELMKGPSLDRLLNRYESGLPWDELQKISIALLSALTHIHEQGVLHGDLKPGNVMLTEKGPQLFDFGLGQPGDGILPGLPRLNRQRLNAWTDRYTAPEVRQGAPLTTQADIYAIARVLFEMAIGRKAFIELSDIESNSSADTSTLKKPSSLPAGCWSVLRLALMDDTHKRRVSARQLLTAFQYTSNNRVWPWT
ncbi:serine/threonine protein kinase [Pseudomonas floridensis]|uniref:Serine/threonine protein kinase n=2 Tax=Pseudomonas floridensis TaxID=1958950 RepID=A0A1X0MZY2_9PSED|nr:serine/threonine protein kinase [Pseudomonas floridensis]